MSPILLTNLPLQLVCQLILSQDLGLDVNQPRNLAKEATIQEYGTYRISDLPMRLVCKLLVNGKNGVNEIDTLFKNEQNLGTGVRTKSRIISPPMMPEGYIEFPEDRVAYKIYETPSSWDAANERCGSEGSHLAIIDSTEKILQIKSMSKSYSKKKLHVGIRRQSIESKSDVKNNEWARIDNGRSIASIPWKQENPRKDGNCVGISENFNGLENYNCNIMQEYFVCQINRSIN